MKDRRPWRGWILLGVLCLGIGTLATIGSSWWIAARGSLHTFEGQYTRKATRGDVPWRLRDEWPEPTQVRIMPGTQRGYEMLAIECAMAGHEGDKEGGRLFSLWRMRFGWPMLAMEKLEPIPFSGNDQIAQAMKLFETKFPNMAMVALPEKMTPFATSGSAFMPTLPIWPGFWINTGIYSLLTGMLLLTPGYLTRRARRKGGKCEKCGYELEKLAICPECGSTRPAAPPSIA